MTERISFGEINPELFKGLYQNNAYLATNGLDRKTHELINYRVSQINGCAFCLDMHHKEAIHAGEHELRLHSLAAWRETPYYTEEERTLLEFAEALTHADHMDISDELFGKMSRFYAKNEIANIALTVVQINSWNRLNKVFRFTPGHYKVGQFESKDTQTA